MSSLLLHDIAFDMEYATRQSREATFAPPSKRSKAGWPHKTPTPADLARAGFYYKPSPQSNDNTVCFLCDRNLDGWEKDDDPVQEHFKHAEDCGWAVLMNIEAAGGHDTSNMEDPTGAQLTNARKATFAIGWPHENKKGWTCKTEKMVEAGWYFAPSQGSEDYVSCAYCKLSLDGWEPKDNPFDEHYSRSPSCPFFVFAGNVAPSKRPKAKKGRTSRASKASTRLSTQSNATIQSEALSIPDPDESIDNSAVSLMSTTSTATNKGKRKAGTSRAKTTKTKRTKTTKSKKNEDSESRVEDETTAIDAVSYPTLQQEQPDDSQHAQHQEVEAMQLDVHEEGDTHAHTVEDLTGPPPITSPGVPAQSDSPMTKQSRGSRISTSSQRQSFDRVEKAVTPVPRLSPSQASDVENAPPSTRPESVRPPPSSPGEMPPRWTAVDADTIFEDVSGTSLLLDRVSKQDLTEAEKKMTVQEWIKHIASKAEGELRAEGERVVGIFEQEGQRALTVLEGIVCV